jgi:hypothetical protein
MSPELFAPVVPWGVLVLRALTFAAADLKRNFHRNNDRKLGAQTQGNVGWTCISGMIERGVRVRFPPTGTSCVCCSGRSILRTLRSREIVGVLRNERESQKSRRDAGATKTDACLPSSGRSMLRRYEEELGTGGAASLIQSRTRGATFRLGECRCRRSCRGRSSPGRRRFCGRGGRCG